MGELERFAICLEHGILIGFRMPVISLTKGSVCEIVIFRQNFNFCAFQSEIKIQCWGNDCHCLACLWMALA